MRQGWTWRAAVLASLAWLLLSGYAAAQTMAAGEHWVASWAASQQMPEPQNSVAPEDLRDATLRQVVHLSIGGGELRVHVSNAFGTSPLRLTAVHVARPLTVANSAIDAASDRPVLFSGCPEVTIPAGAEYVSDPVPFMAAALSDLAITVHYDEPPVGETGHPGSRATSYLAHGDLISAAALPEVRKIEHWYQVSGVDVKASGRAAAIVTLGDSITDGHGATTDGNDRWPDDLARRLQASPCTRMLGVVNEGIGGNRILLDGLGPNALARFDRDVLAQAGARYLIVLEGVNDLGTLTRMGSVSPEEHRELVRQIVSAYGQMIVRAHARGMRVMGGTILPFGGSGYYHPGPENEADRQAINAWIRDPAHFDAVVDFDKAMRDPSRPDRLLPAYDSGDGLHPSPAGYRVMAAAVPLALFLR